MRKLLLVVILVVVAVGAWKLFHQTSDTTPPTISTRPIAELEELVYRDPFNADLQLELARAWWQKFENSLKTDSQAASHCLTAYLIASLESGKKWEIYGEFKQRFLALGSLASLPSQQPFDETYGNMEKLYREALRGSIERIVKLHNEFEKIWAGMRASDLQRPEVTAARTATTRNLRAFYDLEIGRRRLTLRNGDNFRFAKLGYDKWEQGLRSYGLILIESPDPQWHEFSMEDSLNEPIGAKASQIMTGQSYGRYRLPDKREVVPGLRHFQDLAKSGRSSNAQTALPGPSSKRTEGPAAAYRRFLLSRAQHDWAAMYEMLDQESQGKMTDEVKGALYGYFPKEEQRRRLAAMSGKELFAIINENGKHHPIEVASEEIKGDKAIVFIRIHKDNAWIPSKVHFTRVDGVWKMSGQGP